ncbi:Pollen-specific leucine-rich repeat extensin-like protein 1, partial [Cucurbita argyrosperma subsp. argyrosperma]
MKGLGCCLFICVLLSTFSILSSALTDAEASFIAGRQLLALHMNEDLPDNYDPKVEINEPFANPRLRRAYVALQAWKVAIYSDPLNTTANWVGADVCHYTGVYCATALDDSTVEVVAGIDLNHADIAGYLPVELGLLADIALFHINTNRFCGIIPTSFSRMTLLHELDLSNNRFVGYFPEVVVRIPNLKFLDLRFNNFEGPLPPQLFNKTLDAIFLNNNRFTSNIPDTFGDSPASVIVFAYNHFTGCIPSCIGKMGNTLNQLVMLNNDFAGCLPPEVGMLGNIVVFDISANMFSGILSKSFDGLKKVEILDISNNSLTGVVEEGLCNLPKLAEFTFSHNFFNGEAEKCVPQSRKDVVFDDTANCLPERPKQKAAEACTPVTSKSVDCSKAMCGGGASSPSSMPWPWKSHSPHTPQTPGRVHHPLSPPSLHSQPPTPSSPQAPVHSHTPSASSPQPPVHSHTPSASSPEATVESETPAAPSPEATVVRI